MTAWHFRLLVYEVANTVSCRATFVTLHYLCDVIWFNCFSRRPALLLALLHSSVSSSSCASTRYKPCPSWFAPATAWKPALLLQLQPQSPSTLTMTCSAVVALPCRYDCNRVSRSTHQQWADCVSQQTKCEYSLFPDEAVHGWVPKSCSSLCWFTPGLFWCRLRHTSQRGAVSLSICPTACLICWNVFTVSVVPS